MAKQERKKSPGRVPRKPLAQARGRPLTLEALKAYGALRGFAPPAGEFDPAGPWQHTYRLWLVGSPMHRYRGFVEVQRGARNSDGTVDLEVRRHLLMSQHPALHETTVTLKCATDALCTPRSWKLRAETCDIHGKPIAVSRVVESASVKDGAIEVTRGGRRFARRVPTPMTSDVSLFDAVQRLPRDKTRPMRFALLQDMDEVKADQRLSYRERVRFEIGKQALALDCYQQIGRGILPYRYYVDGQGRLLLAISGTRAYILDPKVGEQHEKSLHVLRRRTRR